MVDSPVYNRYQNWQQKLCDVKNLWDEKRPRQFWMSLFMGMQDGYKSQSLDQLLIIPKVTVEMR